MRKEVLSRFLESYLGKINPFVQSQPNELDAIVKGTFFVCGGDCFFIYTKEEAKVLAVYSQKTNAHMSYEEVYDILTKKEFEEFYIL